ncbi:MAG: glycosyltransferase family 4 protein [Thermoanaerobaculia bacterium]|nr:glycosyltransferase family 4 protein [Thermoanaerobaculia bacterium]
MPSEPLHIAFAALYDPRDPRRGSGTCFFIGRELERQGHRVDYIGPIDYGDRLPLATRVLKRLARQSGRRYRTFQDVLVARRIGRKIESALGDSSPDLLLTNDLSIAAYTRCRCPVVLYTSMVFPRRLEEMKHPWLTGHFGPNVLSCRWVNRKGLARADLWCFPSDWGVDLALDYGLAGGSDRAMRIEFGDNLFDPPSADIAAGRSFRRILERGALRVLFVGNRDWGLKGGDVALEAVRELRRRGVAAELDVVGSQPPRTPAEEWIRIHGVIDKLDQSERLIELYATCDLLLVPTRAEGFGIVFVEAAGFGMPSLSFDSGTGVNSAIHHGETGLLLPLDSAPNDFADAIESFYKDPDTYDRLSRGARRFYQDTANWRRAIERLIDAARTRLLERSGPESPR